MPIKPGCKFWPSLIPYKAKLNEMGLKFPPALFTHRGDKYVIHTSKFITANSLDGAGETTIKKNVDCYNDFFFPFFGVPVPSENWDKTVAVLYKNSNTYPPDPSFIAIVFDSSKVSIGSP